MANATNASAAPAATTHTKQYVFVDEYNRHKRLKVMRACDGCRKRKIRCDGALQNGPWPCGACVRLKLKCIPPTLDQDDDQQSTPDGTTGQQTFSFQNITIPNTSPVDIKPSHNAPTSQPQMVQWPANVPPAIPTAIPTAAPTSTPAFQSDFSQNPQNIQHPYQHQPRGRMDQNYAGEDYYSSTSAHQYQQGGHPPTFVRSQTEASSSSSGDPQEIEAGVRELSNQMGDLQIDITSEAPYITRGHLAPDAPALEEAEVVLPASVMTDPSARIPPEMMPSEERAMDYFGYYFNHIHPYVPVLNRAEFLEQWHINRKSISPLLLEAIFACVARYLEQPLESRRWLALAAKHEESVKDVPRLSTIQSLVVLMKAQESIAKRGYYYRSWMTVKYMTTMGIDLDLHAHYDQHRRGNVCTLPKSECMLRTRVWQTLFTLEVLVGAPLGRSDFQVELDTVDCSLPRPSSDVDAFEHTSSRRCTMLAQDMRNIKESNLLWQTMKRYKKDWALDPAFVRHNDDLPQWLKTLPNDFQLQYPEDGSPPWLGGDHFMAYVHVYHHLVVIMHHRPQLQALLGKGDPNWRAQLDICLSSASQMCRIQEALHRDFGFHGLQFMIRGINFTIYCVLTCMMLHLAAITCPDSVLNTQARLYFTRHMRVLEHCIPSANAEMQAQINALREAFSADVRQPFELKPTLGLRSPKMDDHPTPSSTNSGPTQLLTTPAWTMAETASTKSINTAPDYGVPYDTVTGHGMHVRPQMPHHSSSYEVPQQSTYAHPSLQQVSTAPQTGYALEPVISNEQHTPVWDPSGIFNQWATAFGGAPPPQATPPDPRSMQPTSAPIMPNQTSPISTHAMYSAQQVPVNANPVIPDTTPPAMPMVTPVMWQDAFTSAYVSGHGQKRYREASVDHSAYGQYSSTKRRG